MKSLTQREVNEKDAIFRSTRYVSLYIRSFCVLHHYAFRLVAFPAEKLIFLEANVFFFFFSFSFLFNTILRAHPSSIQIRWDLFCLLGIVYLRARQFRVTVLQVRASLFVKRILKP